ncbi:MAG TPA: DUF2007 domain-containing protein [Actinomycetota bacterium]|nr:DUF2007 domain-containing protein [Actinomycetota bacterium]
MDTHHGDRYLYCPRCGSEYRAGFRICSDCGVELVDHLPEEQPAPTRSADYEAVTSWVGTDPAEVFRGSEIDAALVRGVLVDADIPAAVWSSGHEGVYGHAFATAAFPHRVMVHKDDVAEARAILAELETGR